MNKILNGIVYLHQLEKWTVSWESDGNYRPWCHQVHPTNKKNALVVMLNPGSLGGDGKNLTRDTTLRILREVFEETGLNPFIVNLFDYSTPKPEELLDNLDNWINRDNHDNNLLIYEKLNEKDFSGIVFAYGDYEHWVDKGPTILERISLVRTNFVKIPEIVLPTNTSGTPMHPIFWQLHKIKPQVKSIIKSFAKSTD